MSIEACLPPDLRGPTTTITKVSAGLSGAGVYRVDAAGQAFVLKISDESQPVADWRRTLHIRHCAADAGLSPRIVHADEARRAVVSEFVVDRSFPAFYRNPGTHEAALALLGRTLRRVHELPLPPDAVSKDQQAFLQDIWSGLTNDFAVPGFAADAVRRMLVEEPPASERAVVLSHNDVNPTNLIFDGENILLLDWETAAPNDPFFDLAAVSVFLRMDEETCGKLLAAHDGESVSRLPDRFTYDRRFAAVLCGALFLHLARQRGHAGATGDETIESTPWLGDFYKRLMSGALRIDSAEGQWWFGLALLKEGVSR